MTGPSEARDDSAATLTINSHLSLYSWLARSLTTAKVTTATDVPVCLLVFCCFFVFFLFHCLVFLFCFCGHDERQESWIQGGLCGVLSANDSSREWHSAGRTLCVLAVHVVSKSHFQNIFSWDLFDVCSTRLGHHRFRIFTMCWSAERTLVPNSKPGSRISQCCS